MKIIEIWAFSFIDTFKKSESHCIPDMLSYINKLEGWIDQHNASNQRNASIYQMYSVEQNQKIPLIITIGCQCSNCKWTHKMKNYKRRSDETKRKMLQNRRYEASGN